MQKSVLAWETAQTQEAHDAVETVFEQSNVEEVLADPDKAPLSSTSFSPDGQRVLTTNYWRKAWLWNTANWQWQRESFYNYPILHVSGDSFSPDSRSILLSEYAADYKNGPGVARAILWDVMSKFIYSLSVSFVGPLTSASFSPDGTYIATTGEDYTVQVWDTRTKRRLAIPGFRGQPHIDIINSARFSRDGRRLVTAGEDGRAKVWDLKSGAVIELRKRTTALFSAEFSPTNPDIVVTGGQDGTATLWDVSHASGPPAAIFGNHKADVRQAEFDHTGSRVVTASVDGTAEVWDIRDPKKPTLAFTLKGHQGALTAAGFDPTGRLIVTASIDGTARIWRAEGIPEGLSFDAKVGHLRNLLRARPASSKN